MQNVSTFNPFRYINYLKDHSIYNHNIIVINHIIVIFLLYFENCFL